MMMMMITDAEGKLTDAADDAGATETKAATESPPAATEGTSAAESTGGERAAARPSPAPRVVIVTGASSGLGLAVAKTLCAGKHDVILACRNEQKATRAIAKIRKHQPDANATYMQVCNTLLSLQCLLWIDLSFIFCSFVMLLSLLLHWRRQHSKGARSFRGQKILQPGHPAALFPGRKLTTFLVVALKTQAANAVSPSK